MVHLGPKEEGVEQSHRLHVLFSKNTKNGKRSHVSQRNRHVSTSVAVMPTVSLAKKVKKPYSFTPFQHTHSAKASRVDRFKVALLIWLLNGTDMPYLTSVSQRPRFKLEKLFFVAFELPK